MTNTEFKEKEALDSVESLGDKNHNGDVSSNETSNGNVSLTNDEAVVSALEKKVQASEEQYLRLYADFENLRKRSYRDRDIASQTATEKILKNILSIVDDFERAISSTEDNERNTELFVGVGLIYKKLTTFLENSSVKLMQVSITDRFDPNLHEAITSIPSDDVSKKGTIVEILERGYYLNGNVLKFAKVIIAG